MKYSYSAILETGKWGAKRTTQTMNGITKTYYWVEGVAAEFLTMDDMVVAMVEAAKGKYAGLSILAAQKKGD